MDNTINRVKCIILNGNVNVVKNNRGLDISSYTSTVGKTDSTEERFSYVGQDPISKIMTSIMASNLKDIEYLITCRALSHPGHYKIVLIIRSIIHPI